jgi:hypothetical protein
MFISLFQGAVSWFVGLTEAALAIAAMLFIGLVAGMTGFWMLSHFASKLAPKDSYEDDPEEGEPISTVLDAEDPASLPNDRVHCGGSDPK